MNDISLISLVLLPLIYAVLRRQKLSPDDFLLNGRRTGLMATISSTICGNIGIGTFVAIFLFSSASPAIGYSVVGAYGLGLLVCGAFAGRVHALAKRHNAFGLVDLIVATHGVKNKYLIWLPVAAVFLMRTVVQLIALATVLAGALHIPFAAALFCGGGVVAAYTMLGGYKFATETDIFQALIIVGGIAVLGFCLPVDSRAEPDFFDFSAYGLPMLIGIWLFLPFSPLLAIDNWQRIATAADPAISRRGFFIAALVCSAAYFVIAEAGRRLGGEDVVGALRGVMPTALADVMLVAAIMSSIDTFIMPLVTTIAASRGMGFIRLSVAGLFGASCLIALFVGSLLDSVVAAFNALTVFLPVAFGALFLRAPPPVAASATMLSGFILAFAFSFLSPQIASFIGFLFSASLYLGLSLWSRRRVARQPLEDQRRR